MVDLPALPAKQQEFLRLQIPDGRHQATALRQLVEQDRRDAGRGGTHDDHIVRRVGGKSLTPVAGEHLDIPVTQALPGVRALHPRAGDLFRSVQTVAPRWARIAA